MYGQNSSGFQVHWRDRIVIDFAQGVDIMMGLLKVPSLFGRYDGHVIVMFFFQEVWFAKIFVEEIVMGF